MKFRTYVRFLPCFLIACVPLLGHCAGATEQATETGNPPGIQQEKLRILLHGTGVEVVGGAGAVSPGVKVTVTNRSTGDHAEANALADGSVNVVVPGSLQDEYEVTVSNSAGTQTVRVSSDTNGGTVELDELSCYNLSSGAEDRIAQIVNAAPRNCTNDVDCTLASYALRCVGDCGNRFIGVASAAADAFNGAVRSVDDSFCGEFIGRACEGPVRPPCGFPGLGGSERASCVAGECQAVLEPLP